MNPVSIGTESQYSATSPEQTGGGFFSFLFGSEKSTYSAMLALKAFNDNAPQVAFYIVKDSLNVDSKFELDYSQKDKNGMTILHHLTLCCVYYPFAKQLLIDVLENTNAKKYIDTQDVKQNSCVHYAMYGTEKDPKMEDVVKLLAKHGANLTLKNNEGYTVGLKKVPVKENQVKANPSKIFLTVTKSCSDNSANEAINTAIEKSEVSDRLDHILGDFLTIYNKGTDSGNDTIGFKRSISDSFVLPQSKGLKLDLDDDDDDEFKIKERDETKSDDVLSSLMKTLRGKYNKDQVGGAKKKKVDKKTSTKKPITGRRKMTTYSEVSFGGSSDENLSGTSEGVSSDFERNLEQMARAVNNQASEAHANAVKRIKENLGLEDEEARAVKAILYDKVKKDHPEYSNADKAMELEKMASDKTILKEIKKTDIKKMAETIKEKHAQKETSSASSDRSSDHKHKKARMLRSLPDEGFGLSEYDDDDDDSSNSSSSNSESDSDDLELDTMTFVR